MERTKCDKKFINYEYSALKLWDMSGAKRVMMFCVLTTILPTILIILPLYLRHIVFADVRYAVTQSDIVEIHDGLSTIFCQSHSLHMNQSFNAYQVKSLPQISNIKKHTKLKKSMYLPDDTLEYWGFYFLKGALVKLRVCSRFPGSNILVVKGEKDLNTCGLLDNINKIKPVLDKEHKTVSITFDINSGSNKKKEMTPEYDNSNKLISLSLKNKIQNQNAVNQTKNKEKRSIRRMKKVLNNTFSKQNPHHILDRAINHGGNAINYTEKDSEDASSFENGLLSCYDGRILLNQEFPPSKWCNVISVLETPQSQLVTHEVIADGYYYYIFYNDNDMNSNEIYAIFDIYKPTFQYNNLSQTKSCINKTTCSFAVSLWSDETVVVEVPVDNNNEDGSAEIFTLLSICKPRMSIYIFFPITVLFIILGCAFL